MKNQKLAVVKRIGTGLAFIVFPIIFIFAFAIHPNLLSLAIVTDVTARIADFHGNQLMHFGQLFPEYYSIIKTKIRYYD